MGMFIMFIGSIRVQGKLFRIVSILLSVAALVLVACSEGGTVHTPTASGPSPTIAPTGTAVPATEPVPTGESVRDARLTANVTSTDLSVGPNRLTFFLLDGDSQIVKAPEVDVGVHHRQSVASETVLQKASKARFRPWPLGGLGVYTAQVFLDQAGAWTLMVFVTGPDGSVSLGQGTFQVKERSSTPSIGSLAPPSRSKTSGDVDNLEELTTARPPDPDLYRMTIADALASGKPLVAVFATPAFCKTATCGPQVAVVGGVKDRYKDRANFIHVEIFDNPQEIEGDLSKARVAATVEEWGLPSEPWTFILDAQGRIAAKFEAFATGEEIEEELVKVLR